MGNVIAEAYKWLIALCGLFTILTVVVFIFWWGEKDKEDRERKELLQANKDLVRTLREGEVVIWAGLALLGWLVSLFAKKK